MTCTQKIALLGVSATLLFSSAAMAKPKADTNKDGEISKAEFVAHANARFKKSDANDDGVVTREERRAEHERRRAAKSEAQFEKMDSNGDGAISKAEYDAHHAARKAAAMKRRDLNGDGEVNAQDREMRKAKHAERRAKHKEMRKKHKEMRKKHQAMRKELGNRVRPDANGDGVVTFEEHKAATDAMFTRMDVNKDGVLSKGEGRMRHKRKMHKKRKNGGWQR